MNGSMEQNGHNRAKTYSGETSIFKEDVSMNIEKGAKVGKDFDTVRIIIEEKLHPHKYFSPYGRITAFDQIFPL